MVLPCNKVFFYRTSLDVSVSPLTETRINPPRRNESTVIDRGFRREDMPKHQISDKGNAGPVRLAVRQAGVVGLCEGYPPLNPTFAIRGVDNPLSQ